MSTTARILMLFVVSAWLAAGCGRSCSGAPAEQAPGDSGAGGFGARTAFQFPEDHRLHQEPSAKNPLWVESLRFDGVLSRQGTDQGLGYEVALTQRWSAELGRFEYTLEVKIAEPNGDEVVRESFDLLGAPRMRTDRETGDPIWTFTQGAMRIWHKERGDVWEIRVDNGRSGNQQVSGWLTLHNESQGYHPTDDDGERGRGYVHPALHTWGNLTFVGENVPVEGRSRFVHRWGAVGDAN